MKKNNGKGILARWFIVSVSILLTAYLLPGIQISGIWGAILAAAVLGIMNAILKPIIVLLSLPFYIITLGLFGLIVNGLMLALASAITPAIEIDGFGTAIIGAILISIFNMIIGWIIK